MRRALRFVLLSLLALELGYVVVVNAAGFLIPRLIHQDPRRAVVDFKAFTPFPGLVFVRDFALRAQDPYTQWQLRVERATVWVDLKALLNRELHATEVDADGVRFRLRRKLTLPEVRDETVRAQPAIPLFGPVALRQELDPLRTQPPPGRWTIRMDDVEARADEVWVDTLRYEGDLAARGAWWLELEEAAEIVPGHVELLGGRVLRGDAVLADGLRGTVGATIREFPARALTIGRFLEGVDARIHVQGAVGDAASVTPLLRVSPKLLPRWTDGQVRVDARLQAGAPLPHSRIEADLTRAGLTLGALQAQADAHVRAVVRKNGRIDISATAGRARLTKKGSSPLVRDARVRLSTSTKAARVDAVRAPPKARVSIKGARLVDACALNDVIPAPLKLDVNGGRASLDGGFTVDFDRGVASGRVDVAARELSLDYGGERYHGDVDATLRVGGLRADVQSFTLSGSTVKVRNVRSARTGRSPGWSGTVVVRRGSVSLRRREIFRGEVGAKLTNARPLFAALLGRTSLPRLVQKLVAPNHVQANAEVGLGSGMVRLDTLHARVGRTHVHATARLGRREIGVAAVVSLGGLRAGVYQEGGARKVKLFPGSAWYPRQVLAVTGS